MQQVRGDRLSQVKNETQRRGNLFLFHNRDPKAWQLIFIPQSRPKAGSSILRGPNNAGVYV